MLVEAGRPRPARRARRPSSITLLPFLGSKFSKTFQHLIRQSGHVADLSAVDEQGWRPGNLERRAQGNGALHPARSLGFGGAGGGVLPLGAGLFGESGQLFIRRGGSNVALRGIDALHIFPERVGRTASNAVTVVSRLRGPVVRRQ